MKRMHFRKVATLFGGMSVTVPCGTNAHYTGNTTKDESLVTCARCLAWIKKQKEKP